MSISDEKTLYSEIQKKLFYIIPEKWESVYLYASIIDVPNKRPVGEMYFYYFPKGIIKKKPINCYEIPGMFNIDEEGYSLLITDLYNTIKQLRQIFIEKRNKKWSNITVSIENHQFKIEYDYQNLKKSIFDSYERHLIWRYLYLKPEVDLLSKKDKQIIKRYIDYISDVKLPRKDTYTEGIYNQPVKNIVDYEKTLSVDEAIAQSEEPQEKKKMGFWKKKKVSENIEDDDNESFSNQILNYRKK